MRRRTPAAVLLTVLALLAACGSPSARRPASAAAAPSGPRALALLHAWDARRARAWAGADVTALRSLYLPGSVAGRRDVALLRAYAARGYRVEGLLTQVLRARVVVDRARLVRIDLTDRLARAVAVRADGTAVVLPATSAMRRIVELRREHGRWVVGRVELLSPGSPSAGARPPPGRRTGSLR